LPEAPVLRRNLKMAIVEKLNEIEDFDDLKPEDTHFILENRNGEIRFEEGRGILKLSLIDKWKEVEDFDGSKPEDTHFTLNSMKGEIRFGDGL
jgi:hypothetical protein